MKPNLKHIFENVKDGDGLSFYRKAWYLQIIPFFTREKKNEEAPQHVALCYEVKRNTNFVSFKLSEQVFKGGQYREIEIYCVDGKYFTEDDYFNKQNKIALLSLKTPLNNKQKELAITDALKQKGVKYGYNRLLLGIEFLEKIIPDEWQRYIYTRWTEKGKSRHCAIHIQINYKKAGIYDCKDFNITPLEITKLPIYNVIF